MGGGVAITVGGRPVASRQLQQCHSLLSVVISNDGVFFYLGSIVGSCATDGVGRLHRDTDRTRQGQVGDWQQQWKS